jgi:transcriptional regulator with XRE-family HTH domain
MFELAKNLKAIKKEYNITSEDISIICNIDIERIKLMEAGNVLPGYNQLLILADKFNILPHILLGCKRGKI